MLRLRRMLIEIVVGTNYDDPSVSTYVAYMYLG